MEMRNTGSQLPEFRADEATLRQMRQFTRLGWLLIPLQLAIIFFQAFQAKKAMKYWPYAGNREKAMLVLFVVLLVVLLLNIFFFWRVCRRMWHYAVNTDDLNLHEPFIMLKQWAVISLAGLLLNVCFQVLEYLARSAQPA